MPLLPYSHPMASEMDFDRGPVKKRLELLRHQDSVRRILSRRIRDCKTRAANKKKVGRHVGYHFAVLSFSASYPPPRLGFRGGWCVCVVVYSLPSLPTIKKPHRAERERERAVRCMLQMAPCSVTTCVQCTQHRLRGPYCPVVLCYPLSRCNSSGQLSSTSASMKSSVGGQNVTLKGREGGVEGRRGGGELLQVIAKVIGITCNAFRITPYGAHLSRKTSSQSFSFPIGMTNGGLDALRGIPNLLSFVSFPPPLPSFPLIGCGNENKKKVPE